LPEAAENNIVGADNGAVQLINKNGEIASLHSNFFATKSKGKAIPAQAWTGPGGSRRFRLPEFLDDT